MPINKYFPRFFLLDSIIIIGKTYQQIHSANETLYHCKQQQQQNFCNISSHFVGEDSGWYDDLDCHIVEGGWFPHSFSSSSMWHEVTRISGKILVRIIRASLRLIFFSSHFFFFLLNTPINASRFFLPFFLSC